MKKEEVKDIKKVIGAKGKVTKAIISSLVVIVIVTVILVVNGISVNKKHEVKIEQERVKVIDDVAKNLAKYIEDVDVTYTSGSYTDGQMFDLARTDGYVVSGQFVDESGEYIEVTEGKFFKDIDGKVTMLSNVYIGDRYCVFKDDKFDCDKKYKADTDVDKVKEEKVYKIGDVVTLSDGTTWRVIRDSSKNSEYVTLLSDTVLFNASNGTNLWNFSPSKSYKYDKEEERSIAYYLDSKYNRLFNYDGLYEARLMDIYEYRNLDYDDDYEWIHDANLGSWMMYDYSEEDVYYQKVYTYSYSNESYFYAYSMYSYNLDEYKYTLRPVITIRKDKIDSKNVNTPLVEDTQTEGTETESTESENI